MTEQTTLPTEDQTTGDTGVTDQGATDQGVTEQPGNDAAGGLKEDQGTPSDDQTGMTETSGDAQETVTSAAGARGLSQAIAPVDEAGYVEAVNVPVAATFESYIEAMKAAGNLGTKAFISFLDDYVTSMNPARRMTDDVGSQHQMRLWGYISTVVEKTSGEEFTTNWRILLAYANQHAAGVFNPRYVYRFSPAWTRGEDSLNAFNRIIDLVLMTANPATRAEKLRRVALDRALHTSVSPEASQRIVAFYQR